MLTSQANLHATTHDARGPKLSVADETCCEQILADWMAALNAHNAVRMGSFLRFPHVRIAANNVAVYDGPGSNPMDVFEKLIDEQSWHHSAWTDICLVQSSPNKAHYAVQYTRYRADGSVIGVFDSIYVFTCIDGEWKIQARSSFGP
jgi:hypothetical protein